MMDEYEHHNLVDINWRINIKIWWHYALKKNKNLDLIICLFFIEGALTSKTFTLKLIIKVQLQLYNKTCISYIIKIHGVHKWIVFNIDGSMLHSTLNIHV